MNRSIEQALNNIIPRHSGSLPQELVELASSLLAQSRSKASNLKAEEEISRTYICANLACERLKTTLNLPKIEPRPPCAPKIYSKLYVYFDRILTGGSVRTPRKTRLNPTSTSASGKALPERHTPSKAQSFSHFQARTPRKGLKFGGGKNIPAWVNPTVRQMCRELGGREAVPHVLAGVETCLGLLGKGEGEEGGKIPALLVAIWFFVYVKMEGEDIVGREVAQMRRKGVGLLNAVKSDAVIRGKIGEGEEEWRGWGEIREIDVDAWLGEVRNRGWLDMDWYSDITPTEEGEREEAGEGKDGGEEDFSFREEVMRYGLGTMRRKEVDYLSEERREEFIEWKAGILRRVEEEKEEEGKSGQEESTNLDVLALLQCPGASKRRRLHPAMIADLKTNRATAETRIRSPPRHTYLVLYFWPVKPHAFPQKSDGTTIKKGRLPSLESHTARHQNSKQLEAERILMYAQTSLQHALHFQEFNG
ncbi:hypothetical protein B7494_g5977 [Chlorociboria aeruginascens]|nr:hypothetical protein B7494_g5977 [Chlorociboria aeruginascens]